MPACQISSWEEYDRKRAGRLTASQKVDREPADGSAPVGRRVGCSRVAPVVDISRRNAGRRTTIVRVWRGE
jgi:hypothetical protein